jgi:hypothetical protein
MLATTPATPALSATGDNVASWMATLLASVDAMDTTSFLRFLTEDASFRFANAPPAVGQPAIGAMVSGFFGSIKGCRHEIIQAWAPPGHAIARGLVTYTRHDGGTLTLPFVNVFAMREGLIADYQIYIDATPLYAPPQ